MRWRADSAALVVCLTILLGGCGGSQPTNNPVPSLTLISPSSAPAATAGFTLTINGSNFVSNSVARWNGSDRPTTFVSATQLRAEISDADIAVSGTSPVTVFNPAPGGGASPALTFMIDPPNHGVLERVSVASDGTEANGESSAAAISADARYVLFWSDATNLVPDDTNDGRDVFLRDTCRGGPAECTPSTFRVSVADDGSEGNNTVDPSSSPGSSIVGFSADARFVVFGSLADNLVTGDANATFDIFLRDTCIGVPTGCAPSTIRVSVASDGTEADGPNFRSAISADGRFVTFASGASNLVAGDTNGHTDIFLRDTCIGATGCTPSTIRISVDSDGSQSNAQSFFPSMSADGRFVSFPSEASNLVADDTNSTIDIFLRDTCIGATGCTPSTFRVSVASNGAQASQISCCGVISPEGRFVAFTSNASNLVPNDNNPSSDTFLRDTCIGATGCTPSTLLVNVANDGAQGNGSIHEPGAVGADGRFVLFLSDADNLVGGDTNGVLDTYLHDTCLGATGCTRSNLRISIATDGAQGDDFGSWFGVAMTPDIRFVALDSRSTNLVPGDTNLVMDVFLARTGF